MDRYLTALALAATLCASALAGEEGPVERLKSDSAAVEAAAAKEIVAGGEKYLKDIDAAYAALKDDQRQLRERYREVVARIRVEQLKAWATKLSPGLVEKFKWDALVRQLTWTTKPAGADEARKAFCLVSRSAEGWAEDEAVKVLGECLADPAVEIRRAAVAALDRPEWKAGAVELLVKALADKEEIVRVEAGSLLVGRGDQRGLAAALSGAVSKDEKIREACLATVDGLIVSDAEGGAQHPRFKHTKEEVQVLTRLLAIEAWNTRGTVIRLLGMIGDRGASPALMELVAKEEQSKNRSRLFNTLAMLRCRAAAAEIPRQLGKNLSADKRDYNWSAAAAWADIGDPDAVPAMIALLEDAKLGKYASFGLGYAFGGRDLAGEAPMRGTPGQVLVPGADGKLEKKNEGDAKPAELKKAWEAFWAANKDKYKWSDDENPLRPKKKAE